MVPFGPTTIALMTDTPKEQEPGTDVETDHQDTLVDGSLILAEFPSVSAS